MIWLLLISLVIRFFLSRFIELGNDEVYYWTYARYPDWSHFDHPGMVGWLMQLFSLNLLFDSELFLRLPSVILMTLDTCLIYLIGKEIKNEPAGFYAALLYTASVYGFIITGVFILPDTPLMFFFFLTIYLFIRYLKSDKHKPVYLLLGGLSAGCAMLSKYSAAFLWLGMGLYILFFDRKELKNKYLYLSICISALCILPILIWNMQNDFISFTFHSGRVSVFGKFRPDYLAVELLGEFLYNNPFNYILIIIAIIAFARKKFEINLIYSRLLLLTAVPLIGLFLFFSFTRSTLPHWNAPGFSILLIFPAIYLESKSKLSDNQYCIPKSIISALILLILCVCIGSYEIKTGNIQASFHRDKARYMNDLGKGDITLDMYGWKQMKDSVAIIKHELDKTVDINGMVALKWFPAANMDYYIATPLQLDLYAVGEIDQIHKYYWINQYRGGLKTGADYLFIDQSYNYYEPELLNPYFEKITPIDTFPIQRNGRTAEYIFVFLLENYQFEQ